VCLEVIDRTLILAPISKVGSPPLAAGRRTLFEVLDPSGVTHVSGQLEGPQDVEIQGVLHPALRLDVDLGSVKWMNRRAFYRVAVGIKGEIAVFSANEVPQFDGAGRPQRAVRPLPELQLKAVAKSVASRRRPVILRDLSVGGARLSMGSPSPEIGQTALLDLALDHADVLCNLFCAVVDARAGVSPPPFDTQVHLQFVSPPPKHEARLSRYVANIQREMLKKGIRE
jgi:hypothetical protein